MRKVLAVFVVLATILAVGCGLPERDLEYASEISRYNVHTGEKPHSITVVQDEDGSWPHLRSIPEIDDASSYGKFISSVTFEQKNLAGTAFPGDNNVWYAIATDTLSKEQKQAMSDYGDDKLVYVSIAYCDVVT